MLCRCGADCSRTQFVFARSMPLPPPPPRHACLPEGARVALWQELVEVARHVRAISNLHMNLVGDANVWLCHFQVGRHLAVDALIVLFVDAFLVWPGLGQLHQGTHGVGATLDESASVPLHNALECCTRAPVCCQILGSDHFLSVASTTLHRHIPSEVPRCLPPFQDWHPHGDLIEWLARSCRVSVETSPTLRSNG